MLDEKYNGIPVLGTHQLLDQRLDGFGLRLFAGTVMRDKDGWPIFEEFSFIYHGILVTLSPVSEEEET